MIMTKGSKFIASVFLLGVVLFVEQAHAEVELAAVFGDGMVLQRELPVPIWGMAAPGEEVTVTFAGQSVSGRADAKGQWMVKLAPLDTSSENRTLTVEATNNVSLKNVLVGEVWLCSGQSNMAGTFVEAKGRRIDPKDFEVDYSRFRFNGFNKGWDTVSERSQNRISMVAYYFGRELVREVDVPIGLITRYNSGTPIQAWMPEDAADEIRARLEIPENWRDPENKKQRQPGVQFAEKIEPVIPYAVRGVIWYQGERNAKSETACEYDELLAFHIKTWRDLWSERAELPERLFPFYYVQVPTQTSPVTGEWPWLRDRMRRALNITENTGMAIVYDHGPDLHPANKEPFGRRLALLALANEYGREDLVFSGPLLNEVAVEGVKAVLTFDHVGGGLVSSSGDKQLQFFELAGKDGKYAPAEARIEGETVVVQSEAVSEPVYVRYLFRKVEPGPEVSLLNAEGLPASSFMTDDFIPKRTGGLRPADIRRIEREKNQEAGNDGANPE